MDLSILSDPRLPKEVILQILLNIEPEYLALACKINKRIQAICKSDRFKELHKQKYPRYGNYLREENYIVPNYMPNQKQISERRRLILTSWMFEVTVEF